MVKNLLVLLLVAVTGKTMAQSIGDARQFLYYERFNSAEKTLNQIIEKKPDITEAYYWLFQTKLQEGDTTAAREALQAVEKMKQANSRLKVDPMVDAGLVQLLMIDGKKDEAMTKSEEVVKDTKGKNAAVLMALARAQIDVAQGEGDYDYALQLLEKAKKRDKKNPAIPILVGDAWRRKGDGGQAVKSYMEAITLDPNYAEANFKIARIYATQNNLSILIKHYLEAVRQDPKYAPAYYALYYHYYFRDVNEAKRFLEKYIANADKTVDNDYMMVDLLYASSKNQEAINMAKDLLQKQGDEAKPRIFKLIAYSYDAIGDSVNALKNINTYFDKEKPANYVPKDYSLKAKLISRLHPADSATLVEAIDMWQKAVAMDTLATNRVGYMQHIAAAFKQLKNKSKEAYWLGRIYADKKDPSNLDLYYWGLAHFAAGEYHQSDSVFGIYTEKYPEQVHGYLWRAKSNAIIDSTMEQGLAVPYYAKVIDLTRDDSVKNKGLLIQAYGYIGAYEANVKKDYPEALDDFEKILALDPGNAQAEQYSGILKKWINADSESTNSTTSSEPDSEEGKGNK